MKISHKYIISKLENYISRLIDAEYNDLADQMLPILSAIYDRNYTCAIIEMELINLPKEFIDVIRQALRVNKVA